MAYIGNRPLTNSSEFREEFAITTNTSVLNTSGFFASGNSTHLEVYRNGVLLGSDDYTLGSDNSTITLGNAAVAGDIVVVTGRRDNTVIPVEVGETAEEIVMTSATNTVTSPHDVATALTHVYLNGVKLTTTGASPDVTSINPSTKVITFASNLAIGDVVTIVSRVAVPVTPNNQVTHYSTISDDITVPSGQNVAYFGDTTFGGDVTVSGGKMVVAHGAANFQGTVNVTGTGSILNIV